MMDTNALMLLELESDFDKVCIESAPIGIFRMGMDFNVLAANDQVCKSLGYEHKELIGMSIFDFDPEIRPEMLSKLLQKQGESGISIIESTHRRKDGSMFPVEIRITQFALQERTYGVFFVNDISRRIQSEKDLRLAQEELELRVQQRTQEITELNEKLMREMKERVAAEENLYRSRQMLQLILDNIPQRVFWKDRDLFYLGCNKLFAEHAGLGAPDEIVGLDDSQMPWVIEADGYQDIDRWVIENDTPRLKYESPQSQPDGSTMWQRKSKIPLRDRYGTVIGVMGTFEDITESKRIKELLIKSENILAEAQAMAHLGSWEYCLETKKEYRSAEFYRILGIPTQYSGFAKDSMFNYIHPQDKELVLSRITETLEQGKPYNVEYRIIRADGRERLVHAKGKTIKDENDRTTRFIGSILDITERKQAEERNRNQLDRLAALRAIDMAISDSLNLRVTLNVVLDQVASHLNADAADILLLNHACKLEHAASRGFRSNALKQVTLSLGKGSAGCVALERRSINIPDVRSVDDLSRNAPHLSDEGFVSYYGTPLVAKGEVVGVLEVFYRSIHSLEDERLDFLETLAGQAAIAIDSDKLFYGLKRSNIELMMAYDSTLEGWSRALDLRDKETEGHSQRVTDMAEKIARAIGVPDKELIHIRRGAMLHDIGKMGIPDHILLKPAPLDQEERTIMEQHANHAFELLSPIAFLRPALDIPYCHHEKWDGSGYPRGLKGKQIPLAARIFAVIDVWDALRSDRPYRPAWSKEKTLDYILQQSGKHFDPEVLQFFMKYVEVLELG